jgi:lipid-binding SYLF domain-containing protein
LKNRQLNHFGATMSELTRKLTLVICVLLMPLCTLADKYEDTVTTFRTASGSASVFDSAYGYAVFPNIGKGGFGIGGAYGTGKTYVKGLSTGDVKMTQLTIGFQMGGQAYSQIIFFKDKRAYDQFTAGSFEFSAQATAVAITLAANAEASTKGHAIGLTTGEESQAKTRYYKGMAVFTLAKGGLMYEASVGGQKFNFRPNEDIPEAKEV